MRILSETFRTLKPVIYVLWLVAAARLWVEWTSRDANVFAMFSGYSGAAILFAFCGFTGQLDRLRWMGIVVGALLLGVLCWFLPNSIAYTVGQFQGWDHGRHSVDEEHFAIQDRYMKEEGLGFIAAMQKADEELGRASEGRTGPPAETSFGKFKSGTFVGLLTAIGGTLWCLVFGLILVGIPAAVRRRRGVAAGN